MNTARPTPALSVSSPSTDVASPADSVPRWRVYTMSTVGSDAYKIIGTDGAGYTVYESVLPIREAFVGERESEIRHIERKVEIRRAAAESRPPRLAPFGRLRLIP